MRSKSVSWKFEWFQPEIKFMIKGEKAQWWTLANDPTPIATARDNRDEIEKWGGDVCPQTGK